MCPLKAESEPSGFKSECVCVFFCRDSCQRGWRLLYILTAFHRCSDVMKSFVLKFLQDACTSPGMQYQGRQFVTNLTHHVINSIYQSYAFHSYCWSNCWVSAALNSQVLPRHVSRIWGEHFNMVDASSFPTAWNSRPCWLVFNSAKKSSFIWPTLVLSITICTKL